MVVSHDMDFILNCCDRAAFMKDGKVVAIGDPEEIIRKFDLYDDHDGSEGETE